MGDEIRRVMRKTRQYWFADGLVEMVLGSLFILAGVIFAVEAAAPPGSFRSRISSYSLPLLILAGIYGGGRIVKAVKARLTYRRTGFVSYPRPSRVRRALSMLVSVTISATLAVLLLRYWPRGLDSIVLQSMFLALLIGIAGQGLLRFYAVGGLALVLGFGLSRIGTGAAWGNAFLYGILGAAFLLSGAITFRLYLRRTQPSAEDSS